jgi:adenylate kinase
MQRYVVMGPQGCGKGTQARMLAADLGLAHVSSGDLFRQQIAAETELGHRVRAAVAAGALISDDLTVAVVQERLRQPDCAGGFVLDGFPRTAAQAAALLSRVGVDAVVAIDVPDAEVRARVLARRLCSACGRDHNLRSRPPKVPGRCDGCGAPLAARADDTPAAVDRRLAAYHLLTAPAIELFRRRGLVVAVDGVHAPAEVYRRIRAALGLTASSAA